MTLNSEEMIQDIRTDFEQMLDFVTGEDARKATADKMERGIFGLLVRLGGKLLVLFFTMGCQACSRTRYALDDGTLLGYHQDKKRNYFSIFGKVAIWRAYTSHGQKLRFLKGLKLESKQGS